MKKYLYMVLLIISSCGYNPVFLNQNINNLEFKNIIFEGDFDLNNKLTKSTGIVQNNLDNTLNEIVIKSTHSITETSKDSKGDVSSYRSNLTVNVEILNREKTIKSKIFSKSFSYGSKNNKFELVKYQNQIKNNLLDQIVQEIIFFLSINDN